MVFSLTETDKTIDRNAKAFREFLKDYVNQRRAGHNQSTVRNNDDLLSFLLSQPDVFGEEAIVDTVIDFLVAGTETTMTTSQTIINHFCKDPKSMQRVRDEFDSLTNGRQYTLDRDSLIKENLTFENSHDLEYLNRVVAEATRFEPSVQSPSHVTALADFKAGKYHVVKGTSILVWSHGL